MARTTYTVSATRIHYAEAEPDMESCIFTVLDGGQEFEVRIPAWYLKDLTNAEVTDWITHACNWHNRRSIEGDDDVRSVRVAMEARIGTFVDDEITVGTA